MHLLARNLGHRGPVAVPAALDGHGPWRAGGARPEPAPRRQREMCGEPGSGPFVLRVLCYVVGMVLGPVRVPWVGWVANHESVYTFR